MNIGIGGYQEMQGRINAVMVRRERREGINGRENAVMGERVRPRRSTGDDCGYGTK